MSKYSHVVAAVSAVIATVAVAHTQLYSTHAVAHPATACLAVAPGVCFSGSMEWVAATAERLALPVGPMGSMSGDAL